MAKHSVKIIRREAVGDDTVAFSFDKPAGFQFKAGQFLELTLPNPPENDAEGNGRAFSIATAPGDSELMVATRMRDTAFKRVLGKMPIGSQVEIDGPFGNLTLHNNASRPAVLLAGGIGITPFRSMVLRAARERLAHRMVLFYSNHRPEDAAFLGELEALRSENPNYQLVATMTGAAAGSWKGETGRISKEMLLRHLGSLEGPIYYVAGPPAMVAGLQQMLNGAGINEDDIRAEEFAGY